MTSSQWGSLLGLGLCGVVSCGHAVRTETVSSGTEAEAPKAPIPKVKRTVSTKDGTPLATDPARLLEPGAIEKIQHQLESAGKLGEAHANGELDPPTRAALRAFQSANELPATGIPDDATVGKLGFSPGQIFRDAPRK